MADKGKYPSDPLDFIRDCVRNRRIYWTYHVNMRLKDRFLDREMILESADAYEIIEEEIMKCHVCGGEMRPIVTDLPFKVSRKTIVILKELPVLQCERCSEYMLEDQVLERVDVMIANVDEDAELKILKFAA